MSKIQLIKISEIENLFKEKDYKIKTLDIKNVKNSIWNPKDELEKISQNKK